MTFPVLSFQRRFSGALLLSCQRCPLPDKSHAAATSPRRWPGVGRCERRCLQCEVWSSCSRPVGRLRHFCIYMYVRGIVKYIRVLASTTKTRGRGNIDRPLPKKMDTFEFGGQSTNLTVYSEHSSEVRDFCKLVRWLTSINESVGHTPLIVSVCHEDETNWPPPREHSDDGPSKVQKTYSLYPKIIRSMAEKQTPSSFSKTKHPFFF